MGSVCGCGELLPAVTGQCLTHSHHSGQDKPAPLAPAPPCRVSLAPLPQAECGVLGPAGKGRCCPVQTPAARSGRWAGITQGTVRHLPALPSLPPQTYRDSEQGRVLPLVLGTVAVSSLFVSHFFIHRPPAPGEPRGDREVPHICMRY